jgi:hypothetical protein
MTSEEAALRGVLIGGAITLGAAVLGNVFQVWLQWLQQKWSLTTERKKMFAQRRLDALQGAVQLCDFLRTYNGHVLDANRRGDLERILRENMANGALLPAVFSQNFNLLCFQWAFLSDK